MMRKLFRFFLLIVFIFFGIVCYLSLIGFETKKFNPIIKSNLKNIDKKLDVNLNEVKLLLDLTNLSINIKTLGAEIIHDKNKIELESIKTQIPITSIIEKQISSSNISVSTKLVKANHVISFLQSLKNTTNLIVVNKFVESGFLIADLNFNFDQNGKIKEDYEIKGIIKDGKINNFNNRIIKNINLNFDITSYQSILSDIKFSYGDLRLNSEKFYIKRDNNNFHIIGDLKTKLISIKKDEISKYINFKNDFEIDDIKFSSKNILKFSISEKYKIKDYEIKSSFNLEKLQIKNQFDLNYLLPQIKEKIFFKDNQINLVLNKDFFEMKGNGKILLQNDYDQLIYNLKRKNDKLNFNTKFVILKNPLLIKFLNLKNSNEIETTLNLIGEYKKDNKLNFKEISYVNGKNKIKINNLNFNKNNKISSLDNIRVDIFDKFEEKIDLTINKDKKYYNIYGKRFNASILLDDVLTNDRNKKLDLFSENFNLKINIDEILINENEVLNNLKGKIIFQNNNIDKATLNGFFSKDKNLSMTITTKNGKKVTTFFSDKAEPFVKKFDFIKGFNGGSLDYYSVKSLDDSISNSQIKLYDFKLKEVPALTKILTLASLQGIADLLSGDGIRFDDFEMKFENQKNLMTINEIYAIGPAISILMEGYIEKNNLISLRGTLVPATTINKAISSIPVLGEILVGKKTGEGVFGVSFKIKGPPKKTETTVNPIKTLTPRFISRTLEQIK